MKRILLRFLVLGLVLAFNTSCGVIPPPRTKEPYVEVSYAGPKIEPDGSRAYFIKTVLQISTEMVYQQSDYFSGAWHELPRSVWSRSFLCQSDSHGQYPAVIAELPPEKFTPIPIPIVKYLGGPVVFVVSWEQQKAVAGLDRPIDNICFIDLKTGNCRWDTITWNQQKYFYIPSSFYIEPIENGSMILWSTGGGQIGTLDFEGNPKQIDLEGHFEPVCGHLPELEDPKVGHEKTRRSFSRPLWNEEKRVFVLKVAIFKPDSSSLPREVWVFNSKLECVDKFPFKDLAAVIQAKQQNKPLPEHAYAWVIFKMWDWDTSLLSFEHIPSDPTDAASYYNSCEGPKPNPVEFSLKNHTIENKRVNPKDAVSIW